MAVETIILNETFEGGAVGEAVTAENSIFTELSVEAPPYGSRFLLGGRLGGQCGGNVPYGPTVGGTGVFFWNPTYTADSSAWTIAQFYDAFDFQFPGGYGTLDDFRTLLLQLAPTEAEQLDILRGFPLTLEKLVSYEFWFCIPSDKIVYQNSYSGTTAYSMEGSYDIYVKEDGLIRLSAGGRTPTDPVVTLDEWMRVTYERGEPVNIYNGSNALILTSGTDPQYQSFAIYTRGINGVGPTRQDSHPIHIDDVTIVTERLSLAPPVITAARDTVRRRFARGVR